MKRFFGLALLAVAIIAVIGLAIGGRSSSAPWFASVSTGNGYDALVRAAAQMQGKPPAEESTSPFVRANGPMFESLAAALKMPCEVPETMYSETNSALSDLSSFKALALALRAKGRAEMEAGRMDEAIAAYLDMIQLGQRVEHGPLIALLVGIAIENIGLTAIEDAARKFAPGQRKEVAARLEAFNQQRVVFREIAVRERYFARRITMNPIKLLIARVQSRAAFKKAAQKHEGLSADFARVAADVRQ